MSIDTADLTRQWLQSWPQCPPIGYLLRHRLHDRWVRFHSLPLGKRYPTEAGEYDELLNRHNSVLTTMLSECGCSAINLITVEYDGVDLASGSEPIHVGLHPGTVPWIRATDPDDAEASYDLHVSRRPFAPGDLDDLLRYVAEDRTSGVIVADTSLHWLFHPYDGGMDVIAPSVAQRDRLAARFAAWRSDRPDGL